MLTSEVVGDATTGGGGYSLLPIVLSGVLALVLMAGYAVLQHAVTMAHEGGHALTGILFGGDLRSIRLDRRGGGGTDVPVPGFFGDVLTDLAGYLGPSVFALIGILLLKTGEPVAVLWVTFGLLVLMLLVSRGWFTFLAVMLFGVLIYLIARYASSGVQEITAITWIWLLLIGGFADTFELKRVVLSGSEKDDASHLRQSTHLPKRLWVFTFQVGTLVALAVGARALIGLT